MGSEKDEAMSAYQAVETRVCAAQQRENAQLEGQIMVLLQAGYRLNELVIVGRACAMDPCWHAQPKGRDWETNRMRR